MITWIKNLDGFVELTSDEVIKMCTEKIYLIKEVREKVKNKYLETYMSYLNNRWSWLKYFKWLGFKEPTIEDAIRLYCQRFDIPFSYYSSSSDENNCNRLHRFEENICNQLISNARIAKDKMSISLKVLYAINPAHMNEVVF